MGLVLFVCSSHDSRWCVIQTPYFSSFRFGHCRSQIDTDTKMPFSPCAVCSLTQGARIRAFYTDVDWFDVLFYSDLARCEVKSIRLQLV
mmetsp:Transcript_68880/g.109274  ORF Transcript_68880/g.109274 Transcript_68880/m.109274 type:complete len:89 (-) Transcript_68880:7-273(-)